MPPRSADQQHSRRSLLAQLFASTAPVLVIAAAVLIVTPVQVSSNPVLTEALALAAGLAIMLTVHLVLMRRTLAPLRGLTDQIESIDLTGGRRLPEPDGSTREVAALTAAFNRMLERVEEERRRSARRALAAQEDERLRIARELHDQIGQTLTAAAIQAERAAGLAGPAARENLDGVARAAHQGLEEVRRIGRELRPEALDDLGLGNALITLCRRMAAQGEVPVTPRLEPGLPALSSETELVVYRIAQEAITNSLRHAGATRIELALERSGEDLRLTVRDDGRGLPQPLPPDSTGLSGMRERSRLVGGRLALASEPRGGTEVRLAIPLREAAR